MAKIYLILLALFCFTTQSYAENTSRSTKNGGYVEVTFNPPTTAQARDISSFIISNGSSVPLVSLHVKITLSFAPTRNVRTRNSAKTARTSNQAQEYVIFDSNVTERIDEYSSKEITFTIPISYSRDIINTSITVSGPACN